MKKKFSTVITPILVVISTLTAFLVSKFFVFAFGYICGIVLRWLIGGVVANGFNLLLNTERFTSDSIPLVVGTLALIGSFFRTSTSNQNNNE